MSRATKWLAAGTFAMGISLLAVQAQEPVGPPKDKEKKAKIFEGKAFGGLVGKLASSDMLEALRDQNVQTRIGLLPFQIEDLQSLSQQVSGELEQVVRDYQSLPKEEQIRRMEDFRAQLIAFVGQVEREIDRILAPEQQERLRQSAFQLRVKKLGTVAAFTAPELMQEIRIDEQQAERIREAILAIEERYRQRAEELEAAKERDILNQFTKTQQVKLKRMIGPKVQFQAKGSGKDAPKGPPPP